MAALVASTPLLSLRPSRHSLSYGSSWTDATFVDSDEAEDALCNDRPSFVVRNDIMKLIPRKIQRRITHSADLAQIDGFQDLFVHLNSHPGPHELRHLIIAYFRGSPYLREYLKPSINTSSRMLRNDQDLWEYTDTWAKSEQREHIVGDVQRSQQHEAVPTILNASHTNPLHRSNPAVVSSSETSEATLVTVPPSPTIRDYLDGISLQGYELRERVERITANETLRCEAMSLKDHNAVMLVDLLHECLIQFSEPTLHHKEMLRLLQDICSASGELPSKYWLHGLRVNWRQYIARGGEATIYKGTWGGRKVVVREVSRPDENDWASPSGERVRKLIKREIIVHSQLRHHNIIPLLGVYRETKDEPPMMVMPFLENGSASAYLNSAGRGDSDCANILIGSSLALEYLHSMSPEIIHGDLHPNNILVGPVGQAVLCDFGFSRIRHDVTRTHTNIREGGRLRFLAPELSYGQESFRTTTASDVYSLAMTFFNLSTLCLPFEEHHSEWAAAEAARRGQRPQQVNAPRFLAGYFSKLWDLLVMMWEHDTSSRPTAAAVALCLQEILGPLIPSNAQRDNTPP